MNFSLFHRLFLIILVSGCLSFKANASTLTNHQKTQKQEIPTKVRSNIIDIKKNLQLINFIGNAVIEKGQDSVLADKMTLFYLDDKSDNQKNQSKIKKIEASDNVKLFSDDYVATSDNGYYDPSQNSIILKNNVVVNNGASIAKGDKFIYNFKTKKGSFIGQKEDKRAIVIISNDKSLK